MSSTIKHTKRLVACLVFSPGGGFRPRAVQREGEPAAPIAPLFLGADRSRPSAAVGGGGSSDDGGADGGDRSWPLHGLDRAGAAAPGEGGGRSAAGASQHRAESAR